MLYTSYFSKWKGNKSPDVVLMATTYYKPYWFGGEWFSEMAPSAELVQSYKRGEVTPEQYTEIYLKQLESNQEAILSRIQSFDPQKDYILLCFEGPGRFCHRHVFADWVTTKGYPCEEY